MQTIAGSAERTALDTAYRRTRYLARLPTEDLILQVGLHDPESDRRFHQDAGGTVDWAIVTPCNPGSRIVTPACNADRVVEMERLLKRDGRCWFRAVNRDPGGAWPDEPGFFLVDPGIAYATVLGQRFGQNALLHGVPGSAPHLHWL